MSIFDLFWIFFIISALWPAAQRRMLEAARMRLIHEIEKKRSSRVIALIHRQETMALLGFPIFRYIDIEDSEVYKLMALYRQPAQKRPSVSYVPTPYRPPERRGTQP
jgi:ClpP class serine protease